MKLTVRDVLQMDPLQKGEVMAGETGLDNIINDVSVMEVPESAYPLQDNELLLTPFYSIPADINTQLQCLYNLADHKCAGLIICDLSIKSKIASEVIELTNELHIPLIRLIVDKSLSSITTIIVGEILRQQNAKMQLALDVHKELTRLILSGKSAQDLVISLGKILNKPTILLDNNNKFIASHNIPLSKEHIAQLTTTASSFMPDLLARKKTLFIDSAIYPDKKCILSPIISGPNYYGLLIAIADKDTIYSSYSLDVIALEHAGIAFALLSMREKTLQETKEHTGRDFFEELIAGNFRNTHTIINRATELGWELTGRQLLFVVNIDSFMHKKRETISEASLFSAKNKIYRKLKEFLIDKYNNNVVINRSDAVITLMNCPQSEPACYKSSLEIGQAIIKYCAQQQINVSVGISNYFEDISNIPLAYSQARDAHDIGRVIYGTQNCTAYSQLGLYPLLKEMAQNKDVVQEVKNCYQKLEDFDAKNNTDLTRTLKYLIDYDENTADVAEVMHLHKNSILYRKQKINEVLGYNPFARPYRITLQLSRELEKLGQK